MPIYEYRCGTCRVEFQKLILKIDEEKALFCPKCKTKNIKKIMSRVAYHSSEDDRLSSFDPNSRQTDGFYKDNRNIGLSAQKRAKSMGVSLGKGFDEKLEKLRTNPGSVFDNK